MNLISMTEIRRNIRAVLSEIVKTKKPAVILQRSKPVAYLIDAETFDKMQKPEEADVLTGIRKESLDRILRLRAKVVQKTGIQEDSTGLVRELREEKHRYE